MGKITLHADATHQPERLAKFLEQGGVETAFLLNANPNQIQHALNHTSGIVVVRVYDPFREQASRGMDFEKDILFRHVPSVFVSWLNNSDLSRFKGNRRVRFILGWNEMFYNGQNYQREQNRKMLNVAKAMVAVGYGVALFGLAADKTIQMADVEAGVWTEVIDWLKQNHEWAHLDAHEYELGRMASQHLKAQLKPYPESIVDPASMAFSNWGTISYSGDGIKGNWHLGRVAWLGEGFPYALGETGSDYKDDGPIRAWLPVFTAKYGKPQGFPSNRDLYSDLLGRTPANPLNDHDFCEEIYKDLEWFAAQDKAALSHAVFAWNPQSEHAPFNLAKPEFEHLLELLGKQAPMAKPTPVPSKPPIAFPDLASPHWMNGDLFLGQKVNMRSEPYLDDKYLVSTLPAGIYSGKRHSDNGMESEGHTWHAYQLNTWRVWIADDVIKDWEIEPIVLPPPVMVKRWPVVLNGKTFQLTEAEYKTVVEIARLQRDESARKLAELLSVQAVEVEEKAA